MPKLMLIDGNSLVNRAYYGVRPLSAPDGTPTNAVFGFLNILQRLLDDEKPDALCVMFDLREPTFRHKHSEAYKATRKPMPDDLAAQTLIQAQIRRAVFVVLFHLVLLFSPSLDILIYPEHCKLWVRKKQGEIYP